MTASRRSIRETRTLGSAPSCLDVAGEQSRFLHHSGVGHPEPPSGCDDGKQRGAHLHFAWRLCRKHQPELYCGLQRRERPQFPSYLLLYKRVGIASRRGDGGRHNHDRIEQPAYSSWTSARHSSPRCRPGRAVEALVVGAVWGGGVICAASGRQEETRNTSPIAFGADCNGDGRGNDFRLWRGHGKSVHPGGIDRWALYGIVDQYERIDGGDASRFYLFDDPISGAGDCLRVCCKHSTLLRLVLEDLFGEEVFDFGLVAQHLEVGAFEELRAAVAQLLADGLLDLRVVEVALPGGLAARAACRWRSPRASWSGASSKGKMSVIWPGLSLVIAAKTAGSACSCGLGDGSPCRRRWRRSRGFSEKFMASAPKSSPESSRFFSAWIFFLASASLVALLPCRLPGWAEGDAGDADLRRGGTAVSMRLNSALCAL